jgi:hypothetical protein
MQDFEFIILSRDVSQCQALLSRARLHRCTCIEWDGKDPGPWKKYLETAFACINLSGEHVGNGRWTGALKKRIIESRVLSTRALARAINDTVHPPRHFIQASAVGYYGVYPDDTTFTEGDKAGEGFLARVVRLWEESTAELERVGVRCSILRIGVVLGIDDGILSRFLPLFRKNLGVCMGSGRQVISWIHIEDTIRAIRFILDRDQGGVFNLTAPNPVSARTFSQTMGDTLGKNRLIGVPAPLVRLLYGQMGEEVLLRGQKVLPRALLSSGFTFRFPSLREAIHDIMYGGQDTISH